MATSNHTQMAVLGGLSIAPMTGYALREEIRDTLGHFWAESFGQIYPALTELERAGMIERVDVDGRSSKFRITAEGTSRLRELLAEPPQTAQPRDGILLRVFFGRQLGVEACRRLILDSRAQAEEQSAELNAIRENLETAADEDSPFILITVLAGIHRAQAAIAWADQALSVLDGLALRSERQKSSTEEQS